jgi:hypothetical protein
MDKLLAEKIFGVPWTILVAIALVVAIIYVFVDTSAGATGLRWIVMRWFHSLCWLLLALAALAMARITALPVSWANPFGIAGGVTYAIFIATTMLGR